MVQTTVSSSPRGRQPVQGQLLQDLEALNQALYYAGQSKGDGRAVVRRETVESDRSEELRRSPQASIKGASGYLLDMGLMAEVAKERNESPRGRSKNSPVASNIRGLKDSNADVRKKVEVSAEKKKGMWGWKPFQSIAHVGQKKYNCLFTVYVHGIEGLPASMNGLRLAVSFSKRDDAGIKTTPVRVFRGHAEFQETLRIRSSIHGAKNGSKGMKWESKLFTLSVIALEADELNLGKHKLDLTRLLPETMEDDDDDNKRGSWTTSFKLSGKAQAATLVVTFGCEFQREDSHNSSRTPSSKFGESPVLRASRSFSSSPTSSHASPSRYTSEGYHSPSSSEHRADHHEMERLNLGKACSPLWYC